MPPAPSPVIPKHISSLCITFYGPFGSKRFLPNGPWCMTPDERYAFVVVGPEATRKSAGDFTGAIGR
jgi:hypothetical protein